VARALWDSSVARRLLGGGKGLREGVAFKSFPLTAMAGADDKFPPMAVKLKGAIEAQKPSIPR